MLMYARIYPVEPDALLITGKNRKAQLEESSKGSLLKYRGCFLPIPTKCSVKARTFTSAGGPTNVERPACC